MEFIKNLSESILANGLTTLLILISGAVIGWILRQPTVARLTKMVQSLRVEEQDVIADYTGMTAHASVGMVLASLSPNRLLQFTPAHYGEKEIKATENPIAVRVSWESIQVKAPKDSNDDESKSD